MQNAGNKPGLLTTVPLRNTAQANAPVCGHVDRFDKIVRKWLEFVICAAKVRNSGIK